ncbi:MAG: DNA-binding response regulator [Chloroflexi bacterium]|nr:MAG: DNA-binding response regulator [Chloroflexota bacterium]PIE79888.1 MAG: DNA-binding response regulator [Chloroflexota bacterium]
MTHKILVVDDDPTIRQVIRGYLEQNGFTVLLAADGNTALHMLRAESPDLLVLDLMLPDKDGWEITRTIRADRRLAALPIIMLTARIDDMDKVIGLELGADDYVTKPFNGREVVARVRALLRRRELDQPQRTILQVGTVELDTASRTLRVDGKVVDITGTEYNILHALMENANYTFTREELLERGMGYGYEGMGRALDTHIKNLRRKLGNPAWIETMYGVGYRFVEAA